jgi:separase
MDCIRGFPYSLYGFAKHIHRATFESSPAAVQLGTIVDRVTYLGACELLLSPEKVSALSLGLSDANITGALLERQIQSLDGSRWKESTRSVVQAFLRATLEVYREMDMPVRRARTLLGCLDFTYHSGPEALVDLGSPSEMGDEVERILVRKVRSFPLSYVYSPDMHMMQSLGEDAELSSFCAQYRASAHLWLALHAHRRADPHQTAIVAHHVGLACKILEPIAGLAGDSSPAAKKPLPKKQIAAKRAPVSRRAPAPKKATLPRDLVTPHPKRKGGQFLIQENSTSIFSNYFFHQCYHPLLRHRQKLQPIPRNPLQLMTSRNSSVSSVCFYL